MTTVNIPDSVINAASVANAKLVKAVQDRQVAAQAAIQAAEEEALALQKKAAADARNREIVRRLMDQKLAEDLAAVDAQRAIGVEELAQMDHFLDGTPLPGTPAPDAPVADEPVPVEEDDNDNGPHTAVDGQPVPPEDPAPQRQPSAPVRLYRHVESWSRLAWILAVIGAIVGFVAADLTYDFMWANVTNNGWHGFAVFVWFVVLVVTGFFTGGWIGSSIDDRQSS